MPTSLMEPPPPSLAPPRPARPADDKTVEEIIARARRVLPGARGTWWMSLASGLMLWTSFTPIDFGPLAWVALVPLLMLVRMPKPTRRMYLAAACGGWLFALASLQWMRLGDPAMYIAWAALAFYVGLYFPVFVGLSRVAVHRMRIPLVAAAPLVWVGLEYARAYIMTGFSWYYLGHTQHRWTGLLQVSDLVGAYGVSFLVMMGNAALAELVPAAWFQKWKLLPQADAGAVAGLNSSQRKRMIAVGSSVLVLVASLAYGSFRRGQANFKPGPRIGLVQGNFTSSMKHDEDLTPTILRTHQALTGLATRHQADLIVWPETMFRYRFPARDISLSDEQLAAIHPDLPVREFWRNTQVQDLLNDLTNGSRAGMVIGADTVAATKDGMRVYNSALFLEPNQGLVGRYDKIHRVPFGEYVPLKNVLPFLGMFTPAAGGTGLSAGESVHVFQHGDYRLVPLICFEDTVAQLVRSAVQQTRNDKGQEIDCLVNLTNDGWFHGSSELDQHLITAAFRCIETRTPMVRAVNTGISAFIDGDGVVREPALFLDFDAIVNKTEGRASMKDPKTGRYHKQLNAVLVSEVPLDDRTSFYVRWGDWFAAGCLIFSVSMLGMGLVPTATTERRG
jgi:apolipoprotein N-acyltransferase